MPELTLCAARGSVQNATMDNIFDEIGAALQAQKPCATQSAAVTQVLRDSLKKIETILQSTTAQSGVDVNLLLGALEKEHGRLQAKVLELESSIAAANMALAAYDFALGDVSSPCYVSNSEVSPEGEAKVLVVGISDIDKRNEEAIFDALSEFDKKCPYCGKEQYRASIRDKIEIDHFVPVSRGGQNVPWNLIPICKECNRKKKDRLPGDFLSPDIFRRVNTYLLQVRERFRIEGLESHSSASNLMRLMEKHSEFIRQYSSHEFIRELVHLICPEKLEAFQNVQTGAVDREHLKRLISGRIGVFSRGVVGSPFHKIIDQLGGPAVVNFRMLHQAMLEAGWRDCGRLKATALGSYKHIYCAPDMMHISKSKLRRMVEKSPEDQAQPLIEIEQAPTHQDRD